MFKNIYLWTKNITNILQKNHDVTDDWLQTPSNDWRRLVLKYHGEQEELHQKLLKKVLNSLWHVCAFKLTTAEESVKAVARLKFDTSNKESPIIGTETSIVS